MDHAAHGQAQRNAPLLDLVFGVQDAAGVVKAVEGGRQVDDEAGDARGVVFFGRGGNLGREGRQQADQRLLARVGQQGGVGGLGAAEQMRACAYCT